MLTQNAQQKADLSQAAAALPAAPELKSAPIHPSWIIEGEPRTRVAVLSKGSSDESAFMVMWDCTAGRFNWYYAIDETVYIIEGAVSLTLESGATVNLVAGSTHFFGRGTKAEWRVDQYVRKVAFCHEPLSAKVFRAKRAFRAVMRILRPGSAPPSLTKMFEST